MGTVLLVVLALVAVTILASAAGWWLDKGGLIGLLMWWHLLDVIGDIIAAVLTALVDQSD